MLAHIRPHDLYDDIEEVQHHPGGVQHPIHGARAYRVLFPQPAGDFLHDGPQVRLAAARADDVVVRHG